MAPRRLIVIGASTGGLRVVRQVLGAAGRLQAALLVVQHMPEYVAKAYAAHLEGASSMPTTIAKGGDALEEGRILVAPAGTHLLVEDNTRVHLKDGPPVNFVKPSIDTTMFSLRAPSSHELLAGVLLTGMGSDGAKGLLHMKGLGAITIAQSEGTCPVFGMPKEAIALGGVDHIFSPEQIARALKVMAETGRGALRS